MGEKSILRTNALLIALAHWVGPLLFSSLELFVCSLEIPICRKNGRQAGLRKRFDLQTKLELSPRWFILHSGGLELEFFLFFLAGLWDCKWGGCVVWCIDRS